MRKAKIYLGNDGYIPQWIRDIVRIHNLRERYITYHPEEVEMIAAIDWMIDWYRNPQD